MPAPVRVPPGWREEAHVLDLHAVEHVVPRLAREAARLAPEAAEAPMGRVAERGGARQRPLQGEHADLGAGVARRQRLAVRPHAEDRVAPARVVLGHHADPHGRGCVRTVSDARSLSTKG